MKYFILLAVAALSAVTVEAVPSPVKKLAKVKLTKSTDAIKTAQEEVIEKFNGDYKALIKTQKANKKKKVDQTKPRIVVRRTLKSKKFGTIVLKQNKSYYAAVRYQKRCPKGQVIKKELIKEGLEKSLEETKIYKVTCDNKLTLAGKKNAKAKKVIKKTVKPAPKKDNDNDEDEDEKPKKAVKKTNKNAAKPKKEEDDE